MTWTIILENEDKTIISSLSNEFNICTTYDLSGFKLLKYLDPYGDTIFNKMQMDDLIFDLQQIKLLEQESLIEEIILLAKKCKLEIHAYLVFYGD